MTSLVKLNEDCQPIQDRDYQRRVVEQVIQHFEEGISSVGVVSPTGSGKTIMGMAVLKYIEDKYGFRTNWVAMRRTLLRQAAESNRMFFGMKKINFVSMFDKNPPAADVILIDELQHAPTQSFIHIDAKCPAKFMLGLSATPFRTDKLKLPFQKMVQDAGIHRLIQEGWLSQYHHYTMEKYSPEVVANTFITDRDRWGKSVSFFHTMEQCERCQALLADAGIKSEIISGKTPMAKREELLDAFDAGDYPMIINIMVLAEGFDCPDLRTVFIRDSGKLPTIQMGGRAFRTHPDKTHCNIVQSRDSSWQFTRTAKPIRSFAQKGDYWYSLGDNAIIGRVVRETISRIQGIEVEMPKFIIARQKKRKAIHTS